MIRLEFSSFITPCSLLIRLVSFPLSILELAARVGESRHVSNTRGAGAEVQHEA